MVSDIIEGEVEVETAVDYLHATSKYALQYSIVQFQRLNKLQLQAGLTYSFSSPLTTISSPSFKLVLSRLQSTVISNQQLQWFKQTPT